MKEPIAIVGAACRLPGSASSPSKLWELLKSPRDALRDFPSERFDFANFYHRDGETHGMTNVGKRAYLVDEDCRLFDAAFFRVNPREAAGMDPQHRILLETVYEAFEAAGWPLDKVEGSRTSVHVGVMTDDYCAIQTRDLDTVGSHAATGLSRSILSNRISYAFDLKGPSMTIDTACSSSLVALDLAVKSLRSGEASQAIVAGTNMLLDPHWFVTGSSLHMLSPDSRCRMWDADANGYARGEGCAAVLLKPLSRALADGDHIECLVRETGVNSDGRTSGITVPSSSAQAALMMKTYAEAGLDPVDCHYFECHGTGTQAGDPVEARAIRDVFFPGTSDHTGRYLYCGSVKTVIGHLEGCAGLAGLLKASLAIQNKMIPPNMHFSRLNPTVEPFCAHLRIPETLVPWPETHGKPRRASVNSFGFGGTNAHAILESYEPSERPSGIATKDYQDHLLGPFLFSARSRSALIRSLANVMEQIEVNSSLDLDALSCVLHSKRSALSHRLAIPSAEDSPHLLRLIKEQLRIADNAPPGSSFGVRAVNGTDGSPPPGILGIFTGQGAQTAQMGRHLISRCRLFRDSVWRCEKALAELPDPPSWSLQAELSAEESKSRLSEALISQPLCTAIQIALVDLLRASGVRFAAVVGHSSGEIGAAYAAGILTLRDAMGIAYYRGHVAHLAHGKSGEQGGMMAATLSLDDATALCSEPRFSGRVAVAASNAPSSVTLSGDLDAIHDLQVVWDETKIQARRLRVDTAYHSHHMLRCADAYRSHLASLDIDTQKPAGDACAWFSSVKSATNMTRAAFDEELRGQYWVENMLNTVLFYEAVKFAAETSPAPFALGIEIGPHIALKGPVSQTLKPLLSCSLPYVGCLERGKDSVETMSAALGCIWSYLGPSHVDFVGWREAFGLPGAVPMIKDLPSYPWDHDDVFWHESRTTHNYLRSRHRPHALLGRLHEDKPFQKTWRNMLHLNEMPWVRGHTFEGQVLFPAAGYVSLAVEAAKSFVNYRPIKMIEIQDLSIPKALVMNESDGVEGLFTIRSSIHPDSVGGGSVLETEFISHMCSDNRTLEKTCDGRILIHLGPMYPGDLPAAVMTRAELTPMAIDRFHRAVSEIGLGYEGVFRSLTSLSRSWGHAKAMASWKEGDLDANLTLHPALLDVAFQTGLATFLSTAEKAMGSSYLPVGLRRLIIDPDCSYRDAQGQTGIAIEAQMASSDRSAVEVDISVCPQAGDEDICYGIQVDGLILKAIAEPSEDRNIFVKTVWGPDAGYGLSLPSPAEAGAEESVEMVEACERMALFFMRMLIREVGPEELAAAKWHHRELVRYIEAVTATIIRGDHPVLQREWLHDDSDTIQAIRDAHPDNVDLAMLTAVGENLSSVVRGESEMIEHMLKDDLLERLYRESHGLALCNQNVASLMRRIAHKHPRTRILEIGAGTGGTTLSVLESIGDAYASYTCTDISTSFFHRLAEKLPGPHARRVGFKVFNVEMAPSAQGFTEGEYDVVIAANVLHATRRLSDTVRNARSLLRPGGYLIVVEVTGSMLRETGLMGGLEGWWLGAQEGRLMGPGVGVEQWNDILQTTGFSGVDCVLSDHSDASLHSCSVFAAQAVDADFSLLRDPMSSIDVIPSSPLMIIGGRTLPASDLIRTVEGILGQWAPSMTRCESIEKLNSKVMPASFVLCLADLDRALFSEPLTEGIVDNLKEMLGSARNVLWVTRGRLLDDPYSNMMVGIGRALAVELPHVNMSFLDFDQGESFNPGLVIHHVLRQSLSLSGWIKSKNMLWVSEPEVVVRGEKVLIPRLVPDPVANETLNAKRRQITKLIEPEDRIQVCHDSTGRPTLMATFAAEIPEDHKAVEVAFSIALHHRQEAPCFLCCGYSNEPDTMVLALSTIDCSAVIVPHNGILEVSTSPAKAPEVLIGTAIALIAAEAVSSFPRHGTTLVHGATRELSEAIEGLARTLGRAVVFVAVSTVQSERPNWVCLHPRSSARDLGRAIPRDTSMLFTFSDEDADVLSTGLPKYCSVHRFSPNAILREGQHDAAIIASALQTYESTTPLTSHNVVNIKDVPERLVAGRERLSVAIEWARDDPLSCVLQPLEPCHVFSPKKTYFLVGMAGELGQSLCRFMIGGGARHIALASRNPVQDPHWISELRHTGSVIRVVKMDVTDRAQVRDTVAMLRQTMPRIGGVANAALVFEAGIFVNFSAESISRQLRPKVDGTVHLDEAFGDDDLDFFMTFGSLATVCGNPGQALYHAGNMFMTSMMEKRRRRGQNASILHFGLLTDVGYVARMDRAEGSDIEDRLRNLLLTPLSEAEFHHVVLQGVLSGRVGSGSGEVIMGMQPYVDDGRTARPAWVDKVFFSHMIHAPVTVAATESVSKTAESMQTMRERLDRATTLPEATEAVEELICKKVEDMIKVPRAVIDASAPLADLGLDSLNGIDIRRWLLTELQVNLPLLRVLGREPLSSLCASVAAQVMEMRGPVQSFQMETDKTKHLKYTSDDQAGALNSILSPPTSTIHSVASGTATPSSALSKPRNNSTAKSSKFEESKGGLHFKPVERLSFAQEGIHFLHTFLEDPAASNVTTQYRVRGSLDLSRLAQAFEKTLARHEALQTCFLAEPGTSQLKQRVATNLDMRRLTLVAASTKAAQSTFDTVANEEYVLSHGETFRAAVISHGSESHTLIFGFHLIACDALSFSIFLRDLDHVYRMLALPAVSMSFLDFSRQQRLDLDAGRLEDSLCFWKKQLDPLPGVLPLLPIARVSVRPPSRYSGHHIIQRELSLDTAEKVRETSRAYGGTMMQFFLAAMQILLVHMADIDEVCIGVTDHGRGSGDYADTVGHFANILPLRFRIDVNHTFAELVQRTSRAVLSALDHAHVPFDVLLERLGTERSLLHTPLFQAAFNYRIGDILQPALGDCTLEMERYLDVKTGYDLTINITPAAQGHLVECVTSDGLYSRSASQLIADTYIGLVEALCGGQQLVIGDGTLFSRVQVQQAIALGRGPCFDHPWPKSLPERFDQVCASCPDSLAIKDAEDALTYAQLAQRVAVYAASLVADAGPGSRIAVVCEPGIDTYAAMLAILYIGAVYIPLDLSLPSARHCAMLDACEADVLVFHSRSANLAMQLSSGRDMGMLNLSEVSMSENRLPRPPAAGDSFLLFTSGSTGVPKGIRLSQGGIMNYAACKSAMLGLEGAVVLQQTSTGFDMAIAQVFIAFANGGTLVVAPIHSRGDPSMIARMMRDEKVTFTVATPTEYLMLTAFAGDVLRECTEWRHACSGGEAMTERLVEAVRRLEMAQLSLTDCYGPTEVSCATTLRKISIHEDNQRDATVSVGKAIANTSIYILDRDGTVLPRGIPGEICVGGCGVARGYLDAQLSEAEFVRNPLATARDLAQGWEYMFKTGDRGVLQPDGSLTFLGRIDGDTVVKLRGLRIDLAEVAEAILKASPHELLHAVATVRGEPPFILAHVVARGSIAASRLESILDTLPLPQYMIPSMILPLAKLPLTSNGKVDRRAVEALPLPERQADGKNMKVSSLSVPEGELRAVWLEVLGEAAGVHIDAGSDFFKAGGSSLLLVRLQSAVRERFGVSMSLQELYQVTTLRKMAAAMHDQRGRLSEETIDWGVETAIPTDMLKMARSPATGPSPRKHNRQVLLTGSTSFLGGEILRRLLSDDEVARVHCVAVPESEMVKLPRDDKVLVYPGSLVSASLGLSGTELAVLGREVDAIIHAAVQGHCMNSYGTVREALYVSTQTLARLALPRRVGVHLVSAPRVVLLSGDEIGVGERSMAGCQPPGDGSQGVVAAKWASEVFLEGLEREGGGEVVVHRHCALVGDDAPAEEVVNTVVRFSRVMGKVPRVTASGFFDFMDVGVVAGEIVREVLGGGSEKGGVKEEKGGILGGTRFRHHSSGVRVPFERFAQRLEEMYGGKYEVVSAEEWLEAAAERGMGELLVAHLGASMQGPMVFPYLGT